MNIIIDRDDLKELRKERMIKHQEAIKDLKKVASVIVQEKQILVVNRINDGKLCIYSNKP